MKRFKLLLFLLPACIPLLLFWIYPLLNSLYLSFTDWDLVSPNYQLIGFKNYASLLQSKDFHKALLNTLYFTVGSVLPSVIGGFMFAILLNNKIRGVNIYKTILFSPWITPTIAVSIVWTWIFEPRVGTANYILSLFHIPKLEWTHSSIWAMPAILIVTNWKTIGWNMIFYLEALNKVPKTLYDSAKIDGAAKWSRLRYITLPMTSPTTYFLLIINTLNALQAYDQIQILTQGGPAGSTRTLLYLYYQLAFERFNIGEATALAIIFVFLAIMFSAIQSILSKKWVYYK